MLNFLTTTTVCGFSLYHVLAFFLIYSCTGWCLEVIFAAATTGQLVNRGFLNGPVCPIYGFGMIIVLFTLTPLQDSVLLLYIGGVILPSALELVGGWHCISSITPAGGTTATFPSTSAATSVWNSACCGAWARWWSCASSTRSSPVLWIWSRPLWALSLCVCSMRSTRQT